MTYEETLHYLYTSIPVFQHSGASAYKPGLDTSIALDNYLGNPHKAYKTIHVAGTNGKGSVSHLLAAILHQAGYKVGLFTSPHLIDFRERIRVNGKMIPKEYVIDFVERHRTTFEPLHPSFFELTSTMAFDYFRAEEVDFAIIEVGMGGRLDSTNIITPILSIITNISLDHTQFLGDTVEKIAFEKAGIIKEGTPVIFDGNDEAAAEIIQNTAKEHHAPCREIGKNAFEIREVTRKHIAFSRTNAYHKDVIWQVPICGIYQVKNAEIAIEAAQCLLGNKPEHEEMWRDAVAKIQWQGRMEECADHFIIDGAHNPGAIEAFVESVRALKEEEPPILIFSAVSDKKYEQMIEYLCRHLQTKAFVVTEIEDKRRVPAGELGEIFKRYATCPVYVKADVKDAIACAYEMRTKETYIYCIGSLYLAGMVEKALQEVETSC